ncbi:MAG: hypothetical protein LBS72_00080 [Oscillospiraceae bacterium]|jgi:hypothetical protein|nr:hypothetical protein [Oscillospiraceae bacterium]
MDQRNLFAHAPAARIVRALALLALLCALPIMAASAQTVILPNAQLSSEFPADWLIVTPETAARNAAMLGTTADLAETLMRSDNIVVAAFSPAKDAALRVRMSESEDAGVYFDIERYTPEMRAAIKEDYLDASIWKVTGLRFTAAEWKKTSAAGRYLRLTYNRREGDEIVSRGVMAFTVRNGREVTLQLQVEGRQPTSKELKMFDEWLADTKYTPELTMPPLPAGFEFDAAPPQETITTELKIKGKTAPAAVVSASLVQGGSAPFKIGEAVAKASGAFTLPITLPGEGTWTLVLESICEGYSTTRIESPLSCNSARIPINLSTPLEGEIWDAQPRLIGTTLPGVKITVQDGEDTLTKRASEGTFNIKLNPQPEGERTVRVTLSAQGMSDRTVTYRFDRRWNTNDYAEYLDDQAKNISYANLVEKSDKYKGSVVCFTGEVLDSVYEEGTTFIRLATSDKKSRQEVCFAIEEEQLIQTGSVWVCYGRVTGVQYVPNQATMPEEESVADAPVPLFDLLLRVQP